MQLRTLWLTWRLRDTPALSEFVQSNPDLLWDRFAALDRAQLAANAVRLMTELRQRQARALTDPSLQDQVAILRRLASAGGQRPLRRLCTDAPALLPALAPCFLMSPMTVARLLGHSDLRFDVVIFDEASQVLPEDAIGAIGRARQAVVVGDSEQLPPTSFFRSATPCKESTLESLLDACRIAGLPDAWLQWHYRSRHEDLIAFSNREFYQDRLVTFPSSSQAEDPVDFVYVENGMYDRGGKRSNRVEASRLVDLVIDEARRDPAASLGIITFSEPQMIAVQEELDLRRRNDPDLVPFLADQGSDGLFVRNLENVQGDERDFIFISVGYGPDTFGKTMLNFGPINRDGGDRRLNVAITRARRKLTILASFGPDELRASSRRGVLMLNRYLNFARHDASQPRAAVTPDERTGQRFAGAVAQALTRAGPHVEQDIGTGQCRIDVGIKDQATDHQYLLGIVCDGSVYQAATDARDRERLRPQVLERLGWRLHHIWSMAWQNDPGHEIERILELVARTRREMAAPDGAPKGGAPVSVPDSGGTTLELTGTGRDSSFELDWGAGGDEPDPSSLPPISPATAGIVVAPPPVAPRDSPGEPASPVPAPPGPEPDEPDLPADPPEGRGTPDPDSPLTRPNAPAPPAVDPAAGTEVPVAPTPPVATPERAPAKRKKRTPAPKPPPVPESPAPARDATGAQGLDEIKGLTAAAKRQLRDAGITTLGALLKQTATPKDRRAVAKRAGVKDSLLTDWINRADLMRISGIGTQFANLLESCGVASCRELRQRVPQNLLAKLQEVNAERKLASRLPTLAQLEDWIAQADALATDAGRST